MFPNLSISRTTCYTSTPIPQHLVTADMLRATNADTGYSKPSQSRGTALTYCDDANGAAI
jgi:hypothetical protein